MHRSQMVYDNVYTIPHIFLCKALGRNQTGRPCYISKYLTLYLCSVMSKYNKNFHVFFNYATPAYVRMF